MQPLRLIELIVPDRFASESEVLSPESHVFVALMSVEEGPNKAVMLGMAPPPPDSGPSPQALVGPEKQR